MLTSCIDSQDRFGFAEPYLDGFAQQLEQKGYTEGTVRRRVRAAAHFGFWIQRRKLPISELTDSAIDLFGKHLPSCRCRTAGGGKRALAGACLFLEHLRCSGVVPSASSTTGVQEEGSPLLKGFRHWMLLHRGVRPRTLDRYCVVLVALLKALGQDPARFDTLGLRQFVVERGRPYGRGCAQNIASAVRVFLRYLVATGQCAAALAGAIPPVANWRLSSLPRYLPASDVDRLLSTCQVDTPVGLRDLAILLLLCRLGLRAKDVVDLRIRDLDWEEGSLCVSGKGRRQERLPLPQDVGDAILAYLKRGRPALDDDRLFLKATAPRRPLVDSSAVSGIVRRAILRAKVTAPSHGAHLLRHSAATAMLRNGSTLQAIAWVLRHRSIETTAIYAKVDVGMLKDVAQPWPEVTPC